MTRAPRPCSSHSPLFGYASPVAQRGGGARLEAREIDPKLREPNDVAERALLPALGNGAPWFGIDALGAHHRLDNVYLRHRALLSASIDHPSVTDSVRSEAS